MDLSTSPIAWCLEHSISSLNPPGLSIYVEDAIIITPDWPMLVLPCPRRKQCPFTWCLCVHSSGPPSRQAKVTCPIRTVAHHTKACSCKTRGTGLFPSATWVPIYQWHEDNCISSDSSSLMYKLWLSRGMIIFQAVLARSQGHFRSNLGPELVGGWGWRWQICNPSITEINRGLLLILE